MNKLIITAAAIAVATLSACSDKQQGWSIDGVLTDGSEPTIYLEGFDNGHWFVVDSLEVTPGKFAYKSEKPAPYPDIMRLDYNGRFIYFPVDSVDHIAITTDTLGFGSRYTLDGTVSARTVRAIDSILDASVASRGLEASLADAALKRELFTRAFDDPTVASMYYLVNKSVGGRQLFDPTVASDVRYYGAVAQRFTTERPDDPRTAFLSSAYVNARQLNNPAGQSIELEVPEARLIDIVRTDERGESHSLADVAAKGGVTLLSFTAYGLENSPAYNVLLNGIYDKYHANGLEIYQIAFDESEIDWLQTARNLPWITVWNSTTGGNAPLVSYNVGALPTTFILDRTGTLVERVTDPTTLESKVAKYM